MNINLKWEAISNIPLILRSHHKNYIYKLRLFAHAKKKKKSISFGILLEHVFYILKTIIYLFIYLLISYGLSEKEKVSIVVIYFFYLRSFFFRKKTASKFFWDHILVLGSVRKFKVPCCIRYLGFK